MSKLLMTPEEIVNFIKLKETDWKNIRTTNCYAFALGLDLPEKCIMEKAYNIGTIGQEYFQVRESQIRKYSNALLLELDLIALGIEFMEVGPNEHLKSEQWKIALFNDFEGDEFHFLRQTESGIWYQKWGLGNPICLDDNYEEIKDIQDCYIKGYELDCCYSLRLKK